MRFFLFRCFTTRTPATNQFLQRRNIDHPIVQNGRDVGHVCFEKLAIFPDGIAAKGHDARGDVFLDERMRLVGGVGECHRGGADLIEQSGAGVQGADVVVHDGQDVIGLVDDEVRSLIENVQVRVRHDRGDLDDRAFFGVETGHFEVDPDQPVG